MNVRTAGTTHGGATSAATFIALLVCSLLLAALMSRNGELAALALPLLAYLWVGILRAPGEIHLSAERRLSHTTVTSQTPVEAQVTINNGGAPLANLLLFDARLPRMSVIQGHMSQRLALPSGAQAALSYAYQVERGLYAWQAVQAVASDPFGLYEMRQEIPARGKILVRPELYKLRPIPIRPRNTLHSAGSIPAHLAGSGTDFWGVRPYQPGDSLRWLNWHMTARHPQKLFTKEFEQNEIADVGLVLDARPLADIRRGEENLFEHAVRATASLAEVFLREGNRVGMLIFGQNMVQLYPGYGKRQLNRIYWSLARASIGSGFSLNYLKYIPARLFPGRSILVVVSPLGSEAMQDIDAYTRLRAHGYQVILLSPDPVEYAASTLPSNKIERLALRAARLERTLQLQQLLRMGVQVIDWPVSRSLNETIHAAFIQRASERYFVG